MTLMKSVGGVAAAAVLLLSQSAQASLIFVGEEDFTGRGFGAVNNLVTYQATGTPGGPNPPANLFTPQGGIAWNGSTDVIHDNPCGGSPWGSGANGGCITITGADKSQTYSFGDLGISNALQILLFWNPAETGNRQANRVDMAVLNIYDAAGTLVWTSGTTRTNDPGFTPTMHATQNPGTGGSGFAYTLDAAQAGDLNTFLGGFGGNTDTLRIGFFAMHSMMDNGNDTWRIAAQPPPFLLVPEPRSLAILGMGLLGLALVRRRRT